MYLITVYNNRAPTVIHGDFCKVADCSIAIEKNTIPSMAFTIYPDNPGYDKLCEFATTVECIDMQTGDVDFEGRVLSAPSSMDSDGSVCKSVICEGLAGYLCDSKQPYTEEKAWTGDANRNGLQEFIDFLLANHNAHMPPEKQIRRGNVTVQTFKTTENVTKGTNYERTYDAIKSKLVDVFGGEAQVRRGSDGLLYFDYCERLGAFVETPISIGRNIASAKREIKPDQLITRLYPRGCKLTATETDENGTQREVETEERLTIASVNAGKEYIDDDEAVRLYGIIEGSNEWDDVTEPANLKDKAERWLKENNQLPVSTTIDGFDLSLIGIDAHRVRAYNWHRCRNPLIGLDETLEVVKQTINVSEPAESTWEFGDTSAKQSVKISSLKNLAGEIEYVKSQSKSNTVNIKNTIVYTKAAIEVSENAIRSSVGQQIIETSQSLNGRIDGVADDVRVIQSNVSTLEQTSDSIIATVTQLTADQETMQSQIEAMPDSIKLEVTKGYQDYVAGQLEPVNSSISSLTVTADGLTSSVEQLEQGYGTCTTAGATQAKAVSIAGFTRLYKGATICVRFSYANTTANPTLNVSDTGAHTITLNGSSLSASDYWWSAGDVMTLVYDGAYWRISDAGAKSKIKQLANSISLEVSGSLGGTASIVMSVDGDKQTKSIDMSKVRQAFRNDTSAITISAGTITFSSNTFAVNSTYFKVTSTGVITATSGTIGGLTLSSYKLYYGKESLTSDDYGVYVGTDGISVGSGSAYTVLANGYLRGGLASNITGYIGFNNYWTPSGVYGTRLAGKGCIALLTDGEFGIGSYYSYGSSVTITTGQSGSVQVVTDLSLTLPSGSSGLWHYRTITFKKGLMVTSL